MKKALLPVLLLAAGCSACATSLLTGGQESARHPMNELGEMQAVEHGSDQGEVFLGGKSYSRVVIGDARATCGTHAPVEILLPIRDDSASPVIIREATGVRSDTTGTILVYDTISSSPNQSSALAAPAPESGLQEWLDATELKDGEIGPLIIGYHNRLGLSVCYKIGGKDMKATFRPAVVELRWDCRSRLRYGMLMALYPVAVAFDIASFPIQLPFIIFGH